MTIKKPDVRWPWLWNYVGIWPEDPPMPPGEDGNDEPDDELDGETEGENPDNFPNDDFEPEQSPQPEPEPEFEIQEPTPGNELPVPGFSRYRDATGDNWLREFDSWWEFACSAGAEHLAKWTPRNCESHERGNAKWNGTSSFDKAMDMALRAGWPEGRELLNDALVAVAPRPKVYENIEFEVAGAFPCVPIYCAGDPQYMMTDPGASLRSAKPIIRIDYNHWVHALVDIKSMMLRGAAIISLADTLEREGFSTELRIVGNSSAGGHNFRYSITYKQAGETLDLDRAAFAIAHPSSMRRLAFAILEQHKELERDFASGYGRPMYASNDPRSDTIFIPGSWGRETPQSAREAVADAAKDLLNQITEAKEAAD